jgi:hypothetical protein
MDRIWSVLKSTGRDLVIAACVAGTIYLLVTVLDQGELPQDARAEQTAAAGCVPGAAGAPCATEPAASAPATAPAGADAPLYVTVTVAK